MNHVKLEPVGGAVPLDSAFYIARPSDATVHEAVQRHDSLVLLKGARQMGKTSLLARALQLARTKGAKVIFTDLQKLDAAHLATAEAFFLTIADFFFDQLDLYNFPTDLWDRYRPPAENFERYFRNEVLNRVYGPVVWGLDEVDRLFPCSFARDVFGMFQAWRQYRQQSPQEPWQQVTIILSYATESQLFIRDFDNPPVNFDTRVTLEDFTSTSVAELNRRHGSPLLDAADLDRFIQLVGGHPFLVRRSLYEMTANHLTLDQFIDLVQRDEGIFGDHLRRLIFLLNKDPELKAVVKGVLNGGPCGSDESFNRLRNSGLFAGGSMAKAAPRCQLYADYLRDHLR